MTWTPPFTPLDSIARPGHFEIMRLVSLDDHTRATLLDSIASLIFSMVEGFLEFVALRDRHNDGINYPAPPTHSSDLFKLQGRDISLLVEQHKEQLDAS